MHGVMADVNLMTFNKAKCNKVLQLGWGNHQYEVAQRSCGCLIAGIVRDQVAWSFEQLNLVKDIPAMILHSTTSLSIATKAAVSFHIPDQFFHARKYEGISELSVMSTAFST